MVNEGHDMGELACPWVFTHMRRGSRADEVVANLVRSGRKQPQRYRFGSFRLPPFIMSPSDRYLRRPNPDIDQTGYEHFAR